MFKNLDPSALGVSGSQSELIESTMSNGFKGLDLDIVDFAAIAQLHGVAKAKRYLESARLKIGAYRLPASLGAEEVEYRAAFDRLPEYLDLAQHLQCPRAVATVAPSSQHYPYHEHFELVRRRVGELAALLDKQQARLGLEFYAVTDKRTDGAYSFIQSAEAMLMLLKTISAPNVGLALDVWHWHRGGGTLEQLQNLGADRIVTVSLSDAEPDAADGAAASARRR
jgi:sugar phosphate isomerase/epimerase